MPLFDWQPGMRVTAARLNAGILVGEESVTPASEIVNTFYNASYWRGTVSVVFSEPFTSIPVVVATAMTVGPGVVIECSVSSITETGFNLILARSNTTATPVEWIAIQP